MPRGNQLLRPLPPSSPSRWVQILQKGELQVGAKERQHQNDQLLKDIATIVAEKCINPLTNKAITPGLVERAMKEIHFSVKPGKSAKTQALLVIRQLQEEDAIPIERAQMRLKVEAPKGAGRKIKESLAPLVNQAENESFEECFSYVRCPHSPLPSLFPPPYSLLIHSSPSL